MKKTPLPKGSISTLRKTTGGPQRESAAYGEWLAAVQRRSVRCWLHEYQKRVSGVAGAGKGKTSVSLDYLGRVAVRTKVSNFTKLIFDVTRSEPDNFGISLQERFSELFMRDSPTPNGSDRSVLLAWHLSERSEPAFPCFTKTTNKMRENIQGIIQ